MKYPDNYPYIEPCPGCFENFLLKLKGLGGNHMFMSNGDFTLFRFMVAMAKMFPGCTIRVCVYCLMEETVEKAKKLLEENKVSLIVFYYNRTDFEVSVYKDVKNLAMYEVDAVAYYVQAELNSALFTVTGVTQQGLPSRNVEVFTYIGDIDQQIMLRKAFIRQLKKH